MPRLIWSRRAIDDLARLHAFLVAKDSDAARRAIASIRKSLSILREHPEIGRPVECAPTEYREWPIRFGASGYVAQYRFDGRETVILAIRHFREAGY